MIDQLTESTKAFRRPSQVLEKPRYEGRRKLDSIRAGGEPPPGHRERIAEYERRQAAGLPLFDGAEVYLKGEWT